MPSLNDYLILSAILFAIGTAGVFVRRNLITILLSIEIMLNAVNLTFVAFGRALGSVDGQIIVFFVMTVAAAEAAVGLAIVIALFRHRESLNPESFFLKLHPGGEEPLLAAVEDDPGVEELSPVHPRHQADDRVIKRAAFGHGPPPPRRATSARAFSRRSPDTPRAPGPRW